MSEVFEFEAPDGSILEVEAPTREAAIKAFQRMRSEPSGAPSGFMQFMNRGIARGLGGVMDASNALAKVVGIGSERPFLGSERIESGMRDVLGKGTVPRVDERAETGLARVGEAVGQGAAMLPAIGLIGRATGAGLQQVGQPTSMVSETGRMLAQPFFGTPQAAARAPVFAQVPPGSGTLTRLGVGAANTGSRVATAGLNAARSPAASTAAATATELAASAGAGLGGVIGENVAPFGSESLGRGLGEVAGAMSVGGAMTYLGQGGATGYLTRKFGGFVSRRVAPFTETGAREVARGRVQELAADPEGAAARIEEGGPGNLTPAQRTGDVRIMALEREVIERDPAMWEAFQARNTATEQDLVRQLRDIGEGGDVRAAADFVEQRRRQFRQDLDARVADAMRLAEERAATMGPRRSETENAQIIRDELDKAYAAARAEERALWDAIPQDVMVPTTTAREVLKMIDAETGRPRKGNIPGVAKEFLGDDGFGDRETVRDVYALYSALRQTAREARSGAAPNDHKAALADRLALAVLEDVGARVDPYVGSTTSDVGDLINIARSFSADMHQRFTQGEVGRVLGNARSGGDTVNPVQLLETTMRRGGAGAEAASRDFAAALGNNPRARGAEADYLLRQFTDAAVRDGKVRPSLARTFIARNREVLDSFPSIRDQMKAAVRESDTAAKFAERAATIRANMDSPRRSAGAAMDRARFGEEMAAIFDARNPAQSARDLRNTAAKDKTGDAMAGLKAGAIDHVLTRAKSGTDQTGETLFSARAVLRQLDDGRTRAALGEVLSKVEIDRMRRLATELSKVQTARGPLPNIGGLAPEKPNSMVSYLVRVLAARSGAQMGAGTSGASLQAAGMASQRAQRLMEALQVGRAERLLADAVQDSELMRALLLDPANARHAKRIERALTAWFGALMIDSEQE